MGDYGFKVSGPIPHQNFSPVENGGPQHQNFSPLWSEPTAPVFSISEPTTPALWAPKAISASLRKVEETSCGPGSGCDRVDPKPAKLIMWNVENGAIAAGLVAAGLLALKVAAIAASPLCGPGAPACAVGAATLVP